MNRRTLLQWSAAAVAVLPFERVRVFAQPRELSPDAIATLRQIAPTVLPASLGAARLNAIVDRFVVWTREYREGVPLAHGYGHPKLQRSGPSPAARNIAQLAALEHAARSSGGWASLDVESRRALLDDALATAGVTRLPSRPVGQHVVADLMAFYFRSSEANDDCYRAAIGRETCRPLVVTTKRPQPKHV